jgi:hypothetical protein
MSTAGGVGAATAWRYAASAQWNAVGGGEELVGASGGSGSRAGCGWGQAYPAMYHTRPGPAHATRTRLPRQVCYTPASDRSDGMRPSSGHGPGMARAMP